jgi:hypothetical protein
MWRTTDPMVKDRRKSVRYAANGFVHIQTVVGGSLKTCRVTDISDGGVRLYVEGLSVPEEFTLLLSEETTQRRQCRVVWRLGNEIGAAFSDHAEADFGKRAALAQFGMRR